jgi:hypothetical protein
MSETLHQLYLENAIRRDIVREGYAIGKPVRDIAIEANSTPGSVKVLAFKMGLKHPNRKRGRK